MFDTKITQEKFDTAVDHLKEELTKYRVGRAHPEMLADVKVEVYGQKMPLNQVANVTAPDAQLLQITPFDPNSLQLIVEAIRQDQSLGLNPSDDGRLVRAPIPAPNEERRKDLVKQVGIKAEDARIVLRNIRQEAFKDIKKRKDAKEMSEDDAKRFEKEVDTAVGAANDKIEELLKIKEKDILTI